MALFRRRRSPESDSAVTIDAFWAAWPELRTALASAVDAGEPVPEQAAARLTELVQRIHPALGWDVGRAPEPAEPGPAGLDAPLDADPEDLLRQLAEQDEAVGGPAPDYALTLRPGPDDEARVLSERWSRAAPGEPEWVFRPAVPADHRALTGGLDWNGHELDLSHATVELRVDQRRGRVDAGVYHPDFMFLPEEDRAGVAEHVVLLAVGEDDRVRAVGEVRPLVDKPLDPLPPTAVPSVVEQLTGGSGGSWVSFRARVPLRGVIEVQARHPLRRRDFPAFTLLARVELAYTDTDDERQPTAEAAAEMDAFSQRLQRVAGGDGALFGQETSAGKRRLYLYLDPEAGVMGPLEEAARQWPHGASVGSSMDPDWRFIGALTQPIRRQR
ncbi:DUF695 domain-containing protein [Nocardiopsis suaedae]|uniref:DUF695 domain-containing protein n=1 Tax=Nocardiopsis suaedae TaxID=3018444 RepID=A0ABT4TI15_9ACTN|nr:DUF695 domain-containing protein [Nocardiopsis suaedae]MDA2804347.1 DUF695 domain-containing protein [Nocardiopsis suaedae]